MNSQFSGYKPLLSFYLIPEEVLQRTEPTEFPRNPYEVLNNLKWMEVYESDYFQQILIDVWAWLVLPHFGIRGGMECYSGYDPFWRLAHAYPIRIRVLKEKGIAAELFFGQLTPSQEANFLSYEEADTLVGE